MDSFGANSGQRNLLIKDTLTKTEYTQPKTTLSVRGMYNKSNDSFSLSRNDLDRIISTLSSSNITDFDTIKKIVSFNDTERFVIEKLTDFQSDELLSVIKNNISNTIAENIYKTTNNEMIIDLTNKEKAIFDSILSKLQQSKVTNINQAIEFIRSHSSENPTLISKISERLISLVVNIEPQSPLNTLKEDSFSPGFSLDPNKFTNPFKSNVYSRSTQPKTAEESKEFYSQIINTDKDRQRQNEKNIAEASNLIASQLLNKNLSDKALKNLKAEDQVWVNNNMLLKNTTFINDVAAKVATKKAKTIITCRLIGEVGGAIVGALGMASVAGVSPLIGIVGAFVLTILSTVVGFIVGKVSGEMIGKIISGTNFENNDEKTYEEVNNYIEKVSSDKQGHQNNKNKDNNDDDNESNADEEQDKEPQSNNPSGFIMDQKAAEVIKTSVLYKNTQ